MVKIEYNQTEAQVENGIWSCDDPSLLKALKASAPFATRGRYYLPDRDLTLANFAVTHLHGARIVHVDPQEYVPGRVY
jgi:hypothetical protein